jgi:diaminohydroxyphosphoribosylaminopyrimidine deaminase/5-amino-6-(5-phosphoribosylamino)uracil reductase
MVGAGTVRADDPSLTCRIRGGRDPLRVIVDGRLRTPLTARVVSPPFAAGTIIATTTRSGRGLAELRRRGVRILTMPGRGKLSLPVLLRRLAAQGVSTVLLEGGAELAAAALRAGVVDRLLLFFAPVLIGGDGVPMIGSLGVKHMTRAPGLRILEVSHVGVDVLVQAELIPSQRRVISS